MAVAMKRIYMACAAILAATNIEAETFIGSDNGRVLTNPDMGLTMHYYSNVPENYGANL